MTAEAVCEVSELEEAVPLRVETDSGPVCLVRLGDRVHALRDVCSHQEVPLSEGEVYDGSIECWLHGSSFDLRTGQPTGLPATTAVPVYPVSVADGFVYVDTDAPITT